MFQTTNQVLDGVIKQSRGADRIVSWCPALPRYVCWFQKAKQVEVFDRDGLVDVDVWPRG